MLQSSHKLLRTHLNQWLRHHMKQRNIRIHGMEGGICLYLQMQPSIQSACKSWELPLMEGWYTTEPLLVNTILSMHSMSPSTRRETEGTRSGMLFWWGADCAGGCGGFRGERLKMQPFFVNTQWATAEQALAVLAAAGSLPSLGL